MAIADIRAMIRTDADSESSLNGVPTEPESAEQAAVIGQSGLGVTHFPLVCVACYYLQESIINERLIQGPSSERPHGRISVACAAAEGVSRIR